jgi:hypothetical protein
MIDFSGEVRENKENKRKPNERESGNMGEAISLSVPKIFHTEIILSKAG